MKPRVAALIGVLFLFLAAVYWLFPYVVDRAQIDYAGVTMLIALGAAMALMAYVLIAGMRGSGGSEPGSGPHDAGGHRGSHD